jgi:O-antigen/teichoic acid export membrane protein
VISSLRLAFAEEALRHRLRNIGHLLSGSLANLLLSLPAVALTARALGPESYGILALVLSYVQATKRFADFQVWQPIIRYGANLDPVVDARCLAGLYKYGVVIDAAASLASWSLAVIGALAAHFVFGMRDTLLVAALIGSIVLLVNISGTPIAILRLNGSFRSIAYNQLVASMVKLLLCAAAYAYGGELIAFVIIWSVTDALAALLMMAAAYRVLRRQHLHRLDRASIAHATCDMPGLARFTWSSNLSLTLWSSTQQLDTLLVGWLTGPTNAGLYYLVKRISRVVQQTSQQVQAVIFPDAARLWAARDYRGFRRLVRQTECILAAFGGAMFLCFAVAGKFVIELLAGPAFQGASMLLTVQLAALALTMPGTAMRSALLAMDEPALVLKTVLLSVAIFYATALTLIPLIGAMGANVAQMALGVAWLSVLGTAFRRRMARLTG